MSATNLQISKILQKINITDCAYDAKYPLYI